LLDEWAGGDADLALTTGRHFMVVNFDLEPHLFERVTHRAANVLEGIDRRHREVAALESGPVSAVALGIVLPGVPRTLERIDLVEAAVDARAALHAVEDEELVLGPEEGAVGDAGGLEVGLGTLGERAAVALLTLH